MFEFTEEENNLTITNLFVNILKISGKSLEMDKLYIYYPEEIDSSSSNEFSKKNFFKKEISTNSLEEISCEPLIEDQLQPVFSRSTVSEELFFSKNDEIPIRISSRNVRQGLSFLREEEIDDFYNLFKFIKKKYKPKIFKIPDNIDLSGLSKISIPDFGLKSFPKLPYVKELNLKGNNLTYIEEYPYLSKLIINNNKLRIITIDHSYIDYVDCSFNELTILHIPYVNHLETKNNKLISIGPFHKIRNLDASYNALKKIKGKFHYLTELNISHNLIQELSSMIRLTKLNASHNLIKKILMKNMPILQFLDICENKYLINIDTQNLLSIIINEKDINKLPQKLPYLSNVKIIK